MTIDDRLDPLEPSSYDRINDYTTTLRKYQTALRQIDAINHESARVLDFLRSRPGQTVSVQESPIRDRIYEISNLQSELTDQEKELRRLGEYDTLRDWKSPL